ILRYLAIADSVLVRQDGCYALGPRGNLVFDDYVTNGLLTMIGAYGCVLEQLLPALRKEKRYGVDFVRAGDKVARATLRSSRHNHPVVVNECLRLGVKKIADLGCGVGGVIIALCESDPAIHGVGIDIDANAVKEAELHVGNANLRDRIVLLQGDIRKPETF